MVVQVATLSPQRRPFVTPLWFVVEGGVLYLTTGPATRAGRNVAQYPTWCCCSTVSESMQRGGVLRLRGMATCHGGLPSWRVLLRVAAKYYVLPAALPVELRNARKWRLRRRFYGQLKGGFGYIRVVPTGGEVLARP